jgi:hypothetical protein
LAASILVDGPIPIDASIYPEACLREAEAAYQEFLTVERLGQEQTMCVVRLVFSPRSSSEALRLRREFLNYVLDLALRHHLRAS